MTSEASRAQLKTIGITKTRGTYAHIGKAVGCQTSSPQYIPVESSTIEVSRRQQTVVVAEARR